MSNNELLIWICVFAAGFVGLGVHLGYLIGRRAAVKEFSRRTRVRVVPPAASRTHDLGGMLQ